jgi:hypothetical protein
MFGSSGKKKLLEERLDQLIADGELSDADEQTLTKTALELGLMLHIGHPSDASLSSAAIAALACFWP